MAYQGDSNIIGYPDGPEDSDGILNYLEHLAESSRGWKYEVDRTAMRNVLYTVGIQWITYDASLQSWPSLEPSDRLPNRRPRHGQTRVRTPKRSNRSEPLRTAA